MIIKCTHPEIPMKALIPYQPPLEPTVVEAEPMMDVDEADEFLMAPDTEPKIDENGNVDNSFFEVEAALTGFKTFLDKDVPVRMGETTPLRITLHLASDE